MKNLSNIILKDSLKRNSLILVGASILINFLNFVFNAYLGRVLEFRDFALVGLIGGFFSLFSIVFGAFSTTTSSRGGYLLGSKGLSSGLAFWRYMKKIAVTTSLILSVVWILGTPILMAYFKSTNPFVFILFGISLVAAFAVSVNRGFLYSKLQFGSVALINFIDPLIKIASVVLLVNLGFKNWSFAAIPLGVLGMYLVSSQFLRTKATKTKFKSVNKKQFPSKLFTATILNGFSSVALLSFDIILANHFFTPEKAGQYTLLSLVGKMVFFLGNLTSPFVIPLISRDEGAKKDTKRKLYMFSYVTAALSLLGFVSFGLFGTITIPFLFGQKASAIVPLLPVYTLGMVFYTLSTTINSYYLAKKAYRFTFLQIAVVILQLVVLTLFHANLAQIAIGMAFIWALHLALTLLMHFELLIPKILESNIYAFSALFKKESGRVGKKRVLILNWRDTKHVWAGGAEVYVHEIAKRWVKQGSSVTLFCGNDNQSVRNEIIDGVEIVRRGGTYTVYLWAAIYYILKFRKNYDVIIDSENGIPFFAPLFSTKPVILLIHHVHQEIFLEQLRFPLSHIARFIEGKLMPFVYRNRVVITVSESSKKEIVKVGIAKEENINIVNPGIDLPSSTFKKSKVPVVIYLGRLKAYKNIDVAIRAFANVTKTFKNALLYIVGEGENFGNLYDLVLKLGLEKKVKFYGKVSEEEKIKLLSQSWVAVQPSTVEGWGITVLEANACKTPVVASDTKGLRDSVKHGKTGSLVKVKDVKGFSKEIKYYLRNEKVRKSSSKKAYEWAKKFSWQNSANSLNSVMVQEISARKQIRPFARVGYTFGRFTSLF